MNANEVVSADALTETLWGDEPPRSALQNLQTYVWLLRRALAASAGPAIEARAPGYLLRIEPDDLDWLRFSQLSSAASERLNHDPAAAAKLLSEALGYWKGAVVADVADDLHAMQPRMAAMEQARLAALERRIQADLAVGKHEQLSDELAELVANHPLRERFRVQQMLALYRSGRQAEALAAFDDLRSRLADELGVDPGPAIRELHVAILRADRDLDPPAPTATARTVSVPLVPRQLPPSSSGFSGRGGPLRELDDQLEAGRESVVIIAITGPPGVGKTALALYWAHRVQERFPDGTLFADMRGYDPDRSPTEPADVLDGFLRTLSVRPEDIPAGADERAALFRTALDGKRSLIIIDNAASARHVRRLLPGSAGNFVLATSRDRLSGLAARDGAIQVPLGPLAETEAIALLCQTVGSPRVEAEPEAAAQVARLCDGLPLALRIAADHMVARRSLPLAGLAGQLSNERNRLDVLTTDDDDTAVRAAFSWSYRALSRDTARTFRLLGLHPGREFTVDAAAALSGLARSSAMRFLDTLAGAHLVEAIGHERYRMHDLLAAYAAERATGEEEQENRSSAVHRMLAWYLHTADAADRMLIPGRPRPPLGDVPGECRPLSFPGYDEAFAWCETERENLVAATLQAESHGEHVIAWQLPAALGCYLKLSRRWQAWIDMHETGIGAARHVGDQAAQAWLLSSLGGAYGDLRRYEQAEDCFRQALALQQAEGDRAGQGPALLNLGLVMCIQGRMEPGTGCFEEALAIMRETGNRYGEAMALNNLGQTYREIGRHEDALSLLRQALVIFEDTGDGYNQAGALDGISDVYRDTGRESDALTLLRQALELRRQSGDRHGEAVTLNHIAEIHQAKGEAGAAQRHWHLALALLEDLGDPDADRIRGRLTASN